MVCQLNLQIALDKHWQSMFQKTAHISTIGAMTIANREEMTVFQTHYVRIRHISVLVDFVWIMRRYATLCGK